MLKRINVEFDELIIYLINILDQVFDSQAGMPKGIAEGTRATFGDYDICKNIQSPPQDEDGKVISGQYCLSKFVLPYPENIVKPGEKVDDFVDVLLQSMFQSDVPSDSSKGAKPKIILRNLIGG